MRANHAAGRTVEEIASIFGVTSATVRRWIKVGRFEATKETNGRYLAPYSQKNEDLILEYIVQKNRIPSPYIPEEIQDYANWHQIIDEFAWLIKVTYSQPADVKKKRFRIEKLFINYITQNNIGLEKIARHLESSSVNSDLVRDDLKRGWYNELAYVFPLKKSVLGLGFKHLELNKEISSARFSFPSWKIITAYYSMYFYLRSLVLYKNSSFRLGEHSATISSFNHNAFDSLSESLLYFPFNIAYRPRHRIIKKQLPIYALRHLRYGYSSHPREPWSSPSEIYEKIRREFADRGKSSLSGRKPRAYTIFNFLKDFRIWANYLDIDNLLSLWGPGYLGYLDQNLSLFCFFIGGLAELAFISQYGQAKYIENLQVLYSLVSDRVDKDVARNFVETPPYQRMTIFKKLGFVTNQIVLREQDSVNRMDL